MNDFITTAQARVDADVLEGLRAWSALEGITGRIDRACHALRSLADQLDAANAAVANIRASLTDGSTALEQENARLLKERDAARKIICDTAAIIDPECPDTEAYADGHCSLADATKRALGNT